MEMFYLQYEAIPSPRPSSQHDLGGAYISCWIKAKTLDQAKAIAENDINNNGWLVKAIEEAHPISIQDYDERSDSAEYLKQGKLDGEAYVYHAWPNEPQQEG